MSEDAVVFKGWAIAWPDGYPIADTIRHRRHDAIQAIRKDVNPEWSWARLKRRYKLRAVRVEVIPQLEAGRLALTAGETS